MTQPTTAAMKSDTSQLPRRVFLMLWLQWAIIGTAVTWIFFGTAVTWIFFGLGE